MRKSRAGGLSGPPFLMCLPAYLRVLLALNSLLLPGVPYLRNVPRYAAVPIHFTRCAMDYERLAVDHDGRWTDADRLGCVQLRYRSLALM